MNQEMNALLIERFGKDSLLALATVSGDMPHVRAVNAYYMDGAFYCVTYAKSGKMKQIAHNHIVGLCGEWFTGHAKAESLGHVLDEKNGALMQVLRRVFSSWYSDGHVNEIDPDTILLKLTLTDGVLMKHGCRYEF